MRESNSATTHAAPSPRRPKISLLHAGKRNLTASCTPARLRARRSRGTHIQRADVTTYSVRTARVHGAHTVARNGLSLPADLGRGFVTLCDASSGHCGSAALRHRVGERPCACRRSRGDSRVRVQARGQAERARWGRDRGGAAISWSTALVSSVRPISVLRS